MMSCGLPFFKKCSFRSLHKRHESMSTSAGTDPLISGSPQASAVQASLAGSLCIMAESTSSGNRNW